MNNMKKPEPEKELRRCKNSRRGNHEFREVNCFGSWKHRDNGGPIFLHKRMQCKHCGVGICFGWDLSKQVRGGWY